jgi:hypothetical protein
MQTKLKDEPVEKVVAELSDEQFLAIAKKLNAIHREVTLARINAGNAASNYGSILFGVLFLLSAVLALMAISSTLGMSDD